MTNYFIHIDSSVECKNGSTTSYGVSTVAWTINYGSKTSYRAGLIYSHLNGPNKIIYEGILAAISTLEPQHFYPGGTDNVFVYIDSQIVINQLNNIQVASKMKRHLDLVRELCNRHPNVNFVFSYKNEKDSEFKEVDILSKQGRRWLPKIVKSLKK